jgi:hypothetical protein
MRSAYRMTGLIFEMDSNAMEQKITEHLTIRTEEKDKFGEVFTPSALIDEMLCKIPSEVWKDPERKWLDPANGVGNFPIKVYERLLKELPDVYDGTAGKYSDENGKKLHIVMKMLYMVELNPRNVKIAREIFGSDANICCANFLEEEAKWKSEFAVERFDVIVGNPPFQIEQNGKRKGGYGGRTLWDKFVIKSLDILMSNGYLGFITPAGWRKPESKLYRLMSNENQLLYIHILGQNQVKKLFHVSQRIDLYIMQKKSNYKDTEVIDELGNQLQLDLSKWVFLPSYDYATISKILTTEENGIKVIYNCTIYKSDKSNLTDVKSDRYKYPIVHCINRKGMIFRYTDDNSKGHFGISKVLLNFNRKQYPVNDYEGYYGMSQITFGIPITSKKEGDDIVNAINTDAFKQVIRATKWGVFQTDWRMFKYFKPDFYKEFLGQ